jgi:hypothetical protein
MAEGDCAALCCVITRLRLSRSIQQVSAQIGVIPAQAGIHVDLVLVDLVLIVRSQNGFPLSRE